MKTLQINRKGNINIPKKDLQELSLLTFENGEEFWLMTEEEFNDTVKSKVKGVMVLAPFKEIATAYYEDEEEDEYEDKNKNQDEEPNKGMKPEDIPF